MNQTLTLALSKGRIFEETLPLLERALLFGERSENTAFSNAVAPVSTAIDQI